MLAVYLAINVTSQAQSWDWLTGFGGSGNEYIVDLIVDGDGNAYFTGYFSNTVSFGNTVTSNGDVDIFLAKADSNGTPLWIWSAGGSRFDRGDALAFDDDGNIYVTGFFQDTAMFGTQQFIGITNVFLCKFSPAGNLTWARHWGGTASNVCYGMKFGPDKNLYLVGHTVDTVQWDTHMTATDSGFIDALILKVDTGGTVLMAKTYGGSGHDRAYEVDFLSGGDVVVAGYFTNTMTLGPDVLTSSGGSDGWVGRFTSAGLPVWGRSQSGNNHDQTVSVAVNANDQLYLCGYFYGDSILIGTTVLNNFDVTGYDGFVGIMDQSGNAQWAKLLTGKGSNELVGDLDVVGTDVYFAATFDDSASWDGIPLTNNNEQIIVTRLDPNGDTVWLETHGGESYESGWNVSHGSGHVYITGYFTDSCSVGDHNVVSAGGDDGFIARRPDIIPTGGLTRTAATLGVYPNPTDRWVAVRCDCEEVELFNVSGQSMLRQKGGQGFMTLDVGQITPGVHVLRATSGSQVSVAKLIIR